MKQVIVVRTDLEMGKGKLAGQVAHASHLLVAEALENKYLYNDSLTMPNQCWWYEEWMKTLYRKVVLKTNTETEILRLYEKASLAGIPAIIIRDAGLTQLEPETITCIGLGPCPDEMVDKITGHLKLL